MTPRFGGEAVEARIGDCQCPGTPHPGGDVAYLNPRLSYMGGAAGQNVVASGLSDPDAAARDLAAMYLRFEVRGWNLVDEDGPVPYDADLLLSDWEAARGVAEKADELYSDSLMRPLLAAVSKSLQPGRTAGSTSRTKQSSARRPKQSGPSTTVTSPPIQ